MGKAPSSWYRGRPFCISGVSHLNPPPRKSRLSALGWQHRHGRTSHCCCLEHCFWFCTAVAELWVCLRKQQKPGTGCISAQTGQIRFLKFFKSFKVTEFVLELTAIATLVQNLLHKFPRLVSLWLRSPPRVLHRKSLLLSATRGRGPWCLVSGQTAHTHYLETLC